MKTTVAPMKKDISLNKSLSNTRVSSTEEMAWVDSYSDLLRIENFRWAEKQFTHFHAQKQSSLSREQKPSYRDCLNDPMTWSQGVILKQQP